jgi:hypothetical protein
MQDERIKITRHTDSKAHTCFFHRGSRRLCNLSTLVSALQRPVFAKLPRSAAWQAGGQGEEEEDTTSKPTSSSSLLHNCIKTLRRPNLFSSFLRSPRSSLLLASARRPNIHESPAFGLKFIFSSCSFWPNRSPGAMMTRWAGRAADQQLIPYPSLSRCPIIPPPQRMAG